MIINDPNFKNQLFFPVFKKLFFLKLLFILLFSCQKEDTNQAVEKNTGFLKAGFFKGDLTKGMFYEHLRAEDGGISDVSSAILLFAPEYTIDIDCFACSLQPSGEKEEIVECPSCNDFPGGGIQVIIITDQTPLSTKNFALIPNQNLISFYAGYGLIMEDGSLGDLHNDNGDSFAPHVTMGQLILKRESDNFFEINLVGTDVDGRDIEVYYKGKLEEIIPL